VWQRGENELGAGQRGVIVGDETDVRAAEPRPLASPLVRGGEGERHARVAGDDRAELTAGIPTCAEDSYRDSMHN
jgi:hypothetical protein